jgi:hypothetical protein
MGVFVAFLAFGDFLGLGPWEYPFRCAVLAAVLWFFSRGALDFRIRNAGLSIAVGIAVFAIWIAPDLLWPAYRSHWLFQNSLTGSVASSLHEGLRASSMVLVFRAIRAAVLVPMIEELFWRSWLMRWLIKPDFLSVPLGTYATQAFWITAALFAIEHGPFWEVGLLAGVAYNWLMIRTKSLGDCILAHAVTNGILSAYVVNSGQWQYW